MLVGFDVKLEGERGKVVRGMEDSKCVKDENMSVRAKNSNRNINNSYIRAGKAEE